MTDRKEKTRLLKKATGKKTILEAKLELARRLSLVFTAEVHGGYMPLDELVVHVDKSGSFSVLSNGQIRDGNDEIIEKGDAFVAMTQARAIEYVENPARLFVRGPNRTLIYQRWNAIPWLFDWINPREIERLWSGALEAEKERGHLVVGEVV